jgi:hypothetical protein
LEEYPLREGSGEHSRAQNLRLQSLAKVHRHRLHTRHRFVDLIRVM